MPAAKKNSSTTDKAQAGTRAERSSSKNGPRIGLALAGGGPEGAIYEIGALKALDEALDGFDTNQPMVFVGVSAGALIGAFLANGITIDQLCRSVVSHEPGEQPFLPETFLSPALGEWMKRGLSLPRLLAEAIGEYLGDPREHTLTGSLTRLGRALPVAMFENRAIRDFVADVLSRGDRVDDFRQLDHKLIVVAADLDSGQAVRFGDNGFKDVPISLAVQASTALPGLYPPVEIDDRFYVDGVLLKTLHASVALDAGADLLLCVNPIVPVDTVRAVEDGVMKRGKLIDRGLPSVLSQTFRTLIHSRLEVGMAAYDDRYLGSDVVLLEPKRDDYRMFFTNVFSFEDRRTVCEHAYQRTRTELRERAEDLAPIFAKHGVTLRMDVLEDEERDLWAQVGLPDGGRSQARKPKGNPRSSKSRRNGSDKARAGSNDSNDKSSAAGLVSRLDSALDQLDRLVGDCAN